MSTYLIMSRLCFVTAVESKILSWICEQDDTMAFLPKSVFPPTEILPETPENSIYKEFPDEEILQVMPLLFHVEILQNAISQFEQTVELTF